MAIKRIDELTAATPLLTDFLPATPTGGPSTKATVKQLYESNIFAVSVAYTGTAPPFTRWILVPKYCVQNQSTVIVPDGVAVESFSMPLSARALPATTTLTFSNMCGINGALDFYTNTVYEWPNLTSFFFPALVYVGGKFKIQSFPKLVVLSFPLLANVDGDFAVSGLPAAYSVMDFPSLVSVGGELACTSNNNIVTFSFPSLKYVNGNFQLQNCNLATSVNVPLLAFVAMSFSLASFSNLLSFTASSLQFVAATLYFYGATKLASVSLPSLTSIGCNPARTVFLNGYFLLDTCVLLASCTLPAIEVIGSNGGVSISIVSGTPALTTFTLGSTLQRVEGNVIMTSNALLVASVDGILVRLAALDGTGLTTAYSTKTVTITGTSATPSATGLSAKATLVARGCTVTHN